MDAGQPGLREQRDAWVQRCLGVAPRRPAAAAGSGAPDKTVFATSRKAWLATRQKVEGDIAKLQGALAAAYAGHGAATHVIKAFESRVETMLGTLDHSLAAKLDEVTRTTDTGEHAKLVQEARQIMARYVAYVAGEPIIAKLDNNPFVSISIVKTLTTTLTALSRTVR